MQKKVLLLVVMLLCGLYVQAQRYVDKLDRGVVAVKSGSSVFVSWRIFGEEYYDVCYNLYRDGTKLNASPLSVSNFSDTGGSTSSTYQVAAVVRGVEMEKSKAVSVWSNDYLEITPKHDASLTSTYVPNDACCADVDGDGQMEILMKYDNQEEANARYQKTGNNGEYSLLECLKLDGTVLWWVNCGPNMGDFQNNEQNIVGYDWDRDGKAEGLMRLCEGAQIHMANGEVYTVGGANWKNYRSPKGDSSTEWFTYYGDEYLVYVNGATGEPYQCIEYPLKRLEDSEWSGHKGEYTNSSYSSWVNSAWGDGYGHRSNKFFFGAPYLDGRHASIFLARGIYTRHKMCALDVDPATHALTTRWTWVCNSSGPWYGQGYHNYSIADVDWDGRDEICFGGMTIDDNGKGLSTTGLGHGDAHHVGDLDPYRHGQEFFGCNESAPANNFKDATTSKILYRLTASGDDGRAIAGNFCNDYPGAMAFSAHDDPISCTTAGHVTGLSKDGVTMNFRLYWDGDLQEESFNGSATRNSEGVICKYGKGTIKTLTGSLTNNDTKATPSMTCDILGDWREEVIMRTASNKIRIYTTTTATPWRNYTLWHDHQYRNGMVWEMCGYNQPPHTSYFLGEMEGITQAPPPLTMTDRTEIVNGGTITTTDEALVVCETNDMTVNVSDGASPYMLFVNTPTWVQGSAPNNATSSSYAITTQTYTHTLQGGAFSGDMRLVKQGDGVLVMPAAVHTYTGNTDVWAGTLRLDGELAGSRLWLNRFAQLISCGGRFGKSIEMDYASVLVPGGEGSKGTVTTDSLILNFGAMVKMDIFGDDFSADTLRCNVLKIGKTGWQNGPAYSTPLLQVTTHPAADAKTIADGRYLIAEAATVVGSLDDIVIEGLPNHKAVLEYEDGKLYLNIKSFTTGHLTWTGAVDGNWDVDKTANFVDDDGNPCTFTPGSTVSFNDSAKVFTVNIVEPVAPGSIEFNNLKKNFSLNGDSIIGEAPIVKNGTGILNVNNVNHSGRTTINGGKVMVASFANKSGNDYGSLGDVSQIVEIADDATIGLKKSGSCSQLLKTVSGTAKIETASGVTLTMEQGLKQAGGQAFNKTGSGALTLSTGQTVKKLIITAGTVNAIDDCMPDSVEFRGGTLYDPNSQNSYSTNAAHFIVPEGKTGYFYADPRCNYTGSLRGGGTFYVYAAGVRNYFNGNWSAFTGTVVPGLSKRGSYDPVFDFNNTYGLPKATVKLESGVTIQNDGKNFAIGNITGEGTLAGTGTWTIGQAVDSAKTFTMNAYSSSPIIKKGMGEMRVMTPGRLTGTFTIQEGSVRVSKNSDYLNGTTKTTVSGKTARLYGPMKLNSLSVSTGGTLSVTSISGGGAECTVTTTASILSGCQTDFVVSPDNITSSLNVTKSLSLNGTVNITVAEGEEVKEGDEYHLWTAASFSGKPTVNLPELPGGLVWNTEELLTKNGTLKVERAACEPGDANGDGAIDVADITAVAAYILGNEPEGFNTEAADVNGDGAVDVADITAIASKILEIMAKKFRV